jgi:PAS domain S-box-containing protein
MKSIIQFIALYLLLFFTLFSFYSTIDTKYNEDLARKKQEMKGVEYLQQLYYLNNAITTYYSAFKLQKKASTIETLKKEAITAIDALYSLHKNTLQFQNNIQASLLYMKKFTFTDEEYYSFLDLINQENYRVGDSAGLFFEADRKLYFINTLITHYNPEFSMSLAITKNILEEFALTKKISSQNTKIYIEQNKLVILSSTELYDITDFLSEYRETQKLKPMMSEVLEQLKIISLLENPIISNDIEHIQEYIQISNELFNLSYKLNIETMNIAKSNYLNIQNELTTKIVYNRLLFLFIILLLSGLFFYFTKVFISNSKKESEIIKLNDDLNKLVMFSKTDKNGYITYVSEALLKFSGYERDELIGKTHSLFKHEDMPLQIYQDMWKTILKKKTWVGELKNKSKDSTPYWVKLTVVPNLDKTGKIVDFIAYRENITYQKEIEVQKQKTQDALDFKSKFLSNMSHEIRTPLSSIIGLSYVLRKTDLNSHQKSIMKKIQYASDLLLGIINDILDISKIESGKLTIESTHFNLTELLKESVELLMNKAKLKNISLDVEYYSLSEFNFLGDTLRISQVLTNLLNNAIKFTEKGGVTLKITQKEDNIMLFEVIDTGIGIEKKNIDSLFKDFTQADMSTSRKYGGTGLGLSISKQLVELMDGRIWVSSEAGKGSTFSFELPLEPTETMQETFEVQEEINSLLEKQVNALENITLLIAEDNKMNQQVIEMILEDTQIKLEFANDGKIAVKKMNSGKNYDLIFMDIQMPNMNGYEATRAIRQFDLDIPIVALSANIMQEDINSALEYGMNDHLAKPIEVAKLHAILLKYLS